jgi:hypothetical protein
MRVETVRIFDVAVLLGWLTWLATSCSDEQTPGCVPGELRPCSSGCPSFADGQQVCSADGRAFGDCACLADGPDDGGSSGSAGSSGESANPPIVGSACAGDDQCGSGLRCLTAESNELGPGGPAGGYCTQSCSTAADCLQLDPETDCQRIGAGELGLCLRTCLSQSPQAGELKCLDRTTLACNSAVVLGLEPLSGDRQPGWCLPQCNSDADCGSRWCDPVSGLCTDAQAEGASVGASCGTGVDCAGRLCLQLSDGANMCSAACRLSAVGVGSTSGCGYATDAAVRDAACLSPLVSGPDGTEGLGDVGVCFELCDGADDCQQLGWGCEPSGLEAELGRAGVCIPPAPAGGGDAGTLDAGSTNADASNGA